jgi:hypothetical protein
MSAASRSIQAGATKRQVTVAAFALLLAVAVLVIVAVGQFTAGREAAAPASGFAPAMHDHGSSSASSEDAGSAWTVDPNSAANDAARHRPRRAGVANPFLKVGQPTGGPDSYAGARKAQ